MEKNKEFILVENAEATLENFTPEFFENFLKSVSIEKIYKGKDHNCRCGCGGKYYESSSKSFKGILTRAKKALEFLREYGDKRLNKTLHTTFMEMKVTSTFQFTMNLIQTLISVIAYILSLLFELKCYIKI